MAILFGKETFEGGSLPASFDSKTTSATGTTVIDATSKVNATYSSKVSFASVGGGSYLIKNLGVNYTSLYMQFSMFIPTAFSYGAANSVSLFKMEDGSTNSVFEFKLDNFGVLEVILQGGTLAYTDTALAISKNVIHKVEIFYSVSATVGAWKVWVDNNTFASPNASASSLNTGTTQMRVANIGGIFADGTITDSVYIDDVIIADTFIGAGIVASPTNLFFF